eukprot:SAG31_NODE_367_length_16811_cov_20.811584_14_plen_278_part_00
MFRIQTRGTKSPMLSDISGVPVLNLGQRRSDGDRKPYWGRHVQFFRPTSARRQLVQVLRDASVLGLELNDSAFENIHPAARPRAMWQRGTTRQPASTDTDKLAALMSTKVINRAEMLMPAAAAVHNYLRMEFGAPVTINVYQHPSENRSNGTSDLNETSRARSICAHSDAQDIIALQLSGCRRWTVWNGPAKGHLAHPFDTGVDEYQTFECLFSADCDWVIHFRVLCRCRKAVFPGRLRQFKLGATRALSSRASRAPNSCAEGGSNDSYTSGLGSSN